MNVTKGYYNGKAIMIIDMSGGSVEWKEVKKTTTEQICEVTIREKYSLDIVCMVEHFNGLLKGSSLAASCLPLTEVSIYERMYEGVLLCALANLIQPNSVDEKSITVKRELLDNSEEGENRKRENRNVGITALQTLGVYMDKDILENLSERSLGAMTGLIVQVLRLVTIGQMHFQKFDALIHLFDGWSEPEDAHLILGTDRETMLLLWVKYQLKKAGSELQLNDLGESLADSKVYSTLLWAVAPQAKRDSLIAPDDIMVQKDVAKRAELVLENAEKLGISGIIKPEHIFEVGKQDSSNPKALHAIVLNLAFLYRIFLAYPNIEAPTIKDKPAAAKKSAPAVSPAQQIIKETGKFGASEETLIRWLNSFGPSTPVVSLKTDLCNGRVLLEVWDAMFPGCVNWKQVKLQHFEMAARRKFNWMANCDIAIGIGAKHGISKNVCSSGNIAAGETKYIASMVFLMMRLHAQLIRKGIVGGAKKVEDLDDQCLTKWFNEKIEKYGSPFRLKSIEDPSLKSTNALGYFGERILVENNLCSSGPGDFPRKPKAAPKSGNAVDSNQDDVNNSGGGAWLFDSVEPVASNPAQLTKFSVTAILMFNKAGVIVYASKLGPETDSAVYRSILMELNALSMKSN